MQLTRHTNRFLARLLMGLVLFAQGFVTTSVYALPDAAPMPAMAGMAEHSMPCHEQQNAGSGCVTHCSQADLINADHAFQPAAPVSAGGWKIAPPSIQGPSPAFSRRPVAVDTGPPLTIRFCSFLN